MQAMIVKMVKIMNCHVW